MVKINLIGFVVAIILLVLAASCKVTKYIDREKIVVDSSVIEQNKTLQRTLKETIEKYEKERETWESTGVVFETDCDTSLRTITKIVYDNGKLQSIEGRVKSLNIDLVERTTELYDAHRQIDSMAFELERKEIALSKKQETIIKTVEKTSRPGWIWWLLLIGAVAGWFIRGYMPSIKKIFL